MLTPAQQSIHKQAGYFLLASCGLVAGIVCLGGLTRLTESGLSMVDWALLHFKPPTTESEWQEYFNKYKEYPEYKINNKGMTVDEFKAIYYMEYLHRMYGRFIGAFFLGGTAYFITRGVSPSLRNSLLAINGLILGQGLMGWYMVRSGLSEEILENGSVPRVSQYRLAAHLGLAFIVYLTMLKNGLNMLVLPKSQGSLGLAKLIFTTAMFGAFVAGLDAGLIYNDFPLMGGKAVPSDIWDVRLGGRNLFENPTTVQFIHRILGISTATAISFFWIYTRKFPLNRHSKIALNTLAGLGLTQTALGISTLLYMVPIPLASAHQLGSLSLLTAATWMHHVTKAAPK